jgi:hypothetical protein
MIAIAFKVLVAMATSACGAWVLSFRGLGELSERRFISVILALQLIPALGLFAALYVAGHQQVTSDVPAYYVPAAQAVMAGQVPFRDFTLSYAPLFPYVGAMLLFVWNSSKAFALFAILLNAGTLLLWHAAAKASFSQSTARASSVLYAASGQVLVQALLGTNQAWIAAALAGSALLLIRGRSFSAGLIQALAACAVKFLALLFWPVLWIFAPQRTRWVGGAALLSIGVYGAFASGGADLLYPLRHEGELTSSANLPYILEPLLGRDSHFAYRLFDGLALLAFAATTAWLYFKARQAPAPQRLNLLLPSLALTELVFMLVSKKSFPGYILFCMYPLMLVMVIGLPDYFRRVTFFSMFNVLLALESSLCFYLGGDNKALSAWLQESRFGPGIQLFLAVDLTLIACYAYLAWVAAGWIRVRARPSLLPLNKPKPPRHGMDAASEGVAVNNVQST